MMENGFRFVSWNIRKAIGRDLRRNPARVLDAIGAMNADVVALQEADLRFKGRGAIFNAEDIRQRTGLTPVVFADAPSGLGWHGNVLLIGPRVQIENSDILRLRGLEPRGAIRADLLVGDFRFRAITAHLALLGAVRVTQARALMQAFQHGQTRPGIIAGDFNAWRREALSLRPLAKHMAMATVGTSFPASRPFISLDRIYHTSDMRPTKTGVIRTGTAPVSSDHLPIWAEFG